MIKLTHVSKRFPLAEHYAVKDVSCTIEDGETLVLLGSSGCGKTTTLRMINRLIEPTEGTIEIDNENIQHVNPVQLRRRIGYAFQQVGLFPHLTVEENISIVLHLNKVSARERQKRADELLEMINLTSRLYAKRYPDELSGGQIQRVGVARALATKPKYLLMDEPFGALDAINRQAMQSELLDLKKRLDVTIVFVTHDIFEALRLGDRIGVMNKGVLEQIGTPYDLINHPKTTFIRDLFQTTIEQIARFKAHHEGTGSHE